MTATFHVDGPYEIPYVRSNKVKQVDRAKLAAFWEGIAVADMIGCYVFGLRASKGIRPWYVGKTTKSFRFECFQPQKLSDHYNDVLHTLGAGKGVPCLFLITLQKQKGKKPAATIDALEKDLIAIAHAKNKNLSNVKSIPKDKQYLIKNVLYSGSGKPNKGEGKFKACLGL